MVYFQTQCRGWENTSDYWHWGGRSRRGSALVDCPPESPPESALWSTAYTEISRPKSRSTHKSKSTRGNRFHRYGRSRGKSQAKSRTARSTPSRDLSSFISALCLVKKRIASSICAGTSSPSASPTTQRKVAESLSVACPSLRFRTVATASLKSKEAPSKETEILSYGPEMRITHTCSSLGIKLSGL